MVADIIVGLLVGILSLVICFAGLRVFFLILPILGFIVGFFVGAAGVTAIFGDGFLSTTLGIVAGFVVALVFALASYFLWYFGVVLAAASSGALLGSGLMSALDVDSGFVIFIVAAAGAIIFGIAALLLAFPVWIVVIDTAFVGAAGVIAGVLLVFNQMNRDELGNGVAWAAIQDSWFWLIGWIVLAALGMLAQIQSIASVRLPDERWTTAQSAPTKPATA